MRIRDLRRRESQSNGGIGLVESIVSDVRRILDQKVTAWDTVGVWEKTPSGQAVAALDKVGMAELNVGIAEYLHEHKQQLSSVSSYNFQRVLGEIAANVARKRPSYNPHQLARLIQLFENHCYGYGVIGVNALIREIETLHKSEPAQAVTLARDFAHRLADIVNGRHWFPGELRNALVRVMKTADPSTVDQVRFSASWCKPFAGATGPLGELIDNAADAKGTRPTTKWRGTVASLAPKAGKMFLERAEASVTALEQLKTPVASVNGDFLRGMLWTCGLIGGARGTALAGRALIACATKISGVGAKSVKGFNAALDALNWIADLDALTALVQARTFVKAASLNRQLVAILERTAQAKGMTVSELEELATPTFELDAQHSRSFGLGSATAVITVKGWNVGLDWYSNGSLVKSPPASSKTAYQAEIDQVRKLSKEISKALAAQKTRIEGLMLNGRLIPYPQWRERYIDHPLVGPMCRKLIWEFRSDSGQSLGMARSGEPLAATGKKIQCDEKTHVRLWHPIGFGLAAIEVWRDHLFQHEIVQPFKQAFREIYLLTDAERATDTYSNRFAAHIIKQHQFSALARQRGWEYQLQGYFDSYSTPTLRLRDFGILAEYFVEVLDVADPTHGQFMSDAGIAMFLATNQVRFLDGSGQPIVLESIPPIVFSEVMRDVDLFVGVSSVGNDPAWIDQGERAGTFDYWRTASFGDLSVTAEMRKAVLDRLLPRLKIADCSHIEGKFLHVKGKLRTYKIHLGSGNILMSPNDQYLCIVPGRDKDFMSKIYVPFEGDSLLAIILSKALLLREDEKITDQTIVRQIKAKD